MNRQRHPTAHSPLTRYNELPRPRQNYGKHRTYRLSKGGCGWAGEVAESNARAERTPLEGRKPELGQQGCAGTATPEPPTRLVKRCGRWAQRAGMPVACGHGRLARLTRTGEASNSGAACAIQGCIALTRTICGLNTLTLRVMRLKTAQSTPV